MVTFHRLHAQNIETPKQSPLQVQSKDLHKTKSRLPHNKLLHPLIQKETTWKTSP